MGLFNRKFTLGEIVIMAGVVIGILDWITDILYLTNMEFQSPGVQTLGLIFILLQPFWYNFIYLVYVGSHDAIETWNQRRSKLVYMVPYALLQQLKLLGSFEQFNVLIHDRFRRHHNQFLFFNLENSFRIQILTELFFETLPMMAIQAKNNNAMGWGSFVAVLSFLVSLSIFLKDLGLLTVFCIRTYIEHREGVALRPQSYGQMQETPKLDKASLTSMKEYLEQECPAETDDTGNSKMHQLVRSSEGSTDKVSQMAEKEPQLLFMLNPQGQTPLDICIEEGAFENPEHTMEQDSPRSLRIDSLEFESKKPQVGFSINLSKSIKPTKIVDESQSQMLKIHQQRSEEKKQIKVVNSVRSLEQTNFCRSVIWQMQKFHPNSSLKFLRQPHRLELRFERSFTMVVKKGRNQLIESFPVNSIRTVYVSTSQLADVRQFKEMKRAKSQDAITTPLHLACQLSNVEAARILLTSHNYDVNILLYERNFLYDLLNTAGYKDFSILSNVFKERKPCVNSGCKMPLNQAILRGNQHIIQTMLAYGSPNPYSRDQSGITPIHVACAKLDWPTLCALVKLEGDPMLPDPEGNTFLHLLAFGEIRDKEYDFAKMACQQFNLKLTRNAKGKTPLNLIRSMDSTITNVRGQPNFKRKLQQFFESVLTDDPSFEDHEGNSPLHTAIITGDNDIFEDLAKVHGEQKNEFIKFQLNLRNSQGKSPIFLAIEHNRDAMIEHLLSDYIDFIEFRAKDSTNGNTPLHMACLHENMEAIHQIYNFDPELCMVPNYQGRSPFFVACEMKNLEMLHIFEDFKKQAILVQDLVGENMLFVCAREEQAAIFNWFQGTSNFFRARGQQNYKGYTIEHVVCMEKKTSIVEEYRPKFDTQDYYGNWPIHYTIAKNDELMVSKYFTKGREYFSLRNFKYETIFHVAARNNSLESLTALLGKTIFIEELLKKDYKGDTPLHTAAKSGSLEVLQFFMTASTINFMKIENDFGLSPHQAVQEKIQICEELSMDGGISQAEQEKYTAKLEQLRIVDSFMHEFTAYLTEKSWNKRFEVPLSIFLEICMDPTLKSFLNLSISIEDDDEEDEAPAGSIAPADLEMSVGSRPSIASRPRAASSHHQTSESGAGGQAPEQ